MNVTKMLADMLDLAFSIAKDNHYEYMTPEVFLLAMCQNYFFSSAFASCGGDLDEFEKDLGQYLDQYIKREDRVDPQMSMGMGQAFLLAQMQAENSGKNYVDITHIVHGIWNLQDCYGVYYMSLQDVEEADLLEAMINLVEGNFDEMDSTMDLSEQEEGSPKASKKGKEKDASKDVSKGFLEFAPCMNDMLEGVNPLIGRENELERTIQILCRKEKNNPIHIGEPGVGKTAITYGLARMINEGKVPDSLAGARIYSLDLGSLLAGTQYRGDLEKRLKKLLEEISKEKNPIIYIDEIHNLAGAGAVGEGSFDVSNLLKPYLAMGKIRFIGASTYEEYKKYFEKNKSLARRFQNVEIPEPSQEESLAILKGLKKKYETFHGVRYGRGIMEYIVQMSTKYINERYLPDKAIDLVDEAGAYRKIHPLDQKTQTVGKDVINDILTKICHIPIDTVKEEADQDLSSLEKRILSKVFGQDEAVRQVVNAIKFSRAGLIDDHKPLSSFLFAGPTGVGKTEIAKTLAAELHVKLLRFDMSEYGEKHAIAKLIGSPAGYVGYEEGGLLTEAIRKNPSCVLLFDEIEKAHHDIFNVLLQVMDYATLTDNQGRKADFRNVIIILTSNAGASQIGKRGIGFAPQDVTSDVIGEEVKRIFQPEFRNRLNKIVIFSGMDDAMAEKIACKKLGELSLLLKEKKVVLSYSKEAIDLLQRKGTSFEFGAREMDRIIQNEIKPLFVDDLLFGKLKRGGTCHLDAKDDTFIVKYGKKSDTICEKNKKNKGD